MCYNAHPCQAFRLPMSSSSSKLMKISKCLCFLGGLSWHTTQVVPAMLITVSESKFGTQRSNQNTLLLAKNAANVLQDSDFATPNEHCTSLPGRHGCHVIPLTLQKLAAPRPCKRGKMLSTWRKWNGKVRKYERMCSWALVATSREFERLWPANQ